MTRDHLPLYLSAPQPCSYLPGRASSSLFLDPHAAMDSNLYGHLLQHGFRRSGGLVYRPKCASCRQCLSVRLPVQRFIARRRHRRILRANATIQTHWQAPALIDEHYRLYRRYTAARHAGGSMSESTPDEYFDFLQSHWCDTGFVELRENGRLLGVAVTDRVDDGLSAVYTFFDPDLPERSLGTYAVLQQLQLACEAGLSYLYLGYWIRDCDKMAYKESFRPLQVLSEGMWREFAPGENILLPELVEIHPSGDGLL